MKLLPQSIREYRLNSIFFKLLIFFILLILLSILLVGFISYEYSSKILVEKVKNYDMLILKQAKDAIDQQVKMLDKITLQLTWDERVNKAFFIGKNLTVFDRVLFRDLINYLGNIKTSTDIIDNISVYFKKSDIIVSNDGQYSANFFFKNVLTNDNMTVGQWRSLFRQFAPLRTLEYKTLIEKNKRIKYISFYRTLPITEPEPYGGVIISLNENVLKSMIDNQTMQNPALVCIVDMDGNILISNRELVEDNSNYKLLQQLLHQKAFQSPDSENFLHQEMHGIHFTISYTTSEVNGWKYISIIPTSRITSQTNQIKNVTIIISLISLLLGLILSYILAKKIYTPISSILSYINVVKDSNINIKNGKRDDEISAINRVIDFIYQQNHNLRQALNTSIPVLREKFINNLLEHPISSQHIQESLQTLNIDLPYEGYEVVVFEINNNADLLHHSAYKQNKSPEIIVDKIAKEPSFSDIRVYSIKKGNEKVISLINTKCDANNPEIVYDFIHRVAAYLEKEYHILLTTAVGKLYTGLKNIPQSYIDALFALKYKVIKGDNSIIHIDEVNRVAPSPFIYPVEREKQIINHIKSGDWNNVNHALREILSENLNKDNVTPEMVHNLFNALASTAIRTVYEIQSTLEEIFGKNYSIYSHLEANITLHNKKEYIIGVFEKITNFINDNKKFHNENLYNHMIQFIQENYKKDLSLNMIAEMIGFSPSYISWIFKDVSGMNFIDYLNSYRVEKAKDLLKENELSIGEIAETVGFNNANYFIRVFKKYEGITPGQYKKSL